MNSQINEPQIVNPATKNSDWNGWRDDPNSEGRWLAKTAEGHLYDADVREYAPGCFEALVHGYAMDWHPTVCLSRFGWILPNTQDQP